SLIWGLLLVILDFSINGFDLLADGLGYLLVASGCRGLMFTSSRFSSARTLCFILAILWLIGFAIEGQLAVLYGLATTVVECTMIWQLLGGIADYAIQRHRSDLAQRAHNRRLAYAGIMAGVTLIGFALHGSNDAGPLVIILVGCVLVLLVMILHLIHRVKTEIEWPDTAT
ncbi:MAG TPA: hypothetical protein DDW52_21505, partial [Planctomycetaceae bacterium]|nr:hypothetical protein [Planctomycetaceae bacterium]